MTEPADPGPKPVTLEQLRNAPVPSLCGYPAGQLADGRVPGVPANGVFELAGMRGPSPGPFVAVGDLNSDRVDEGVAVVLCVPPGSNGGTFAVLVYRGGPMLGEVPFAKEASIPEFYPPSVQDIRIEGGQLIIRGQTHQKNDPHCCPSVFVVERFRVSASSFILDQSSGLGTITPDGMGAVRVGTTLQEVAAASNHPVAPASLQGGGSPDKSPCFTVDLLGAEGVHGIGSEGRLRSIVTTEPAPYKTAEGIHVGSTEAEVVSTYGPNARQYDNLYQNVPDYYVGALPREDGRSLRFVIDPQTRQVGAIHAGFANSVGLAEGCS